MFFFFQAEDGIRDLYVTGVQTCALPISIPLLVPFVEEVGLFIQRHATTHRLWCVMNYFVGAVDGLGPPAMQPALFLGNADALAFRLHRASTSVSFRQASSNMVRAPSLKPTPRCPDLRIARAMVRFSSVVRYILHISVRRRSAGLR